MATGLYTKHAWTPLTPISAKWLNETEQQYDECQYLIDHHAHDDRYYPETISDSAFFWSGHMGSGSSMDADKLDGLHYYDILAVALQKKAIVPWSGTDADVPSGWHICNGALVGGIQTPDLRDRFIVGAGGAYPIGNTGGQASVTISSGATTIASYTLTVSETPAHAHYLYDYYNGGGCYLDPSYWWYYVRNTTYEVGGTTGSAGGGGGHGHPGSSVNVTNSPYDNRPKWYSLFYIMKVV